MTSSIIDITQSRFRELTAAELDAFIRQSDRLRQLAIVRHEVRKAESNSIPITLEFPHVK